ncbi:MAG: NADPH-flavin oxidoreductase, partial [Actinobacteria bacterium]|nr:NADPH-flavin oxidoreductase [Actinomycetota bacterium]
MPVTLVGANVQGKPNYITIAHVGIIDFSRLPPSMGKTHYTHLCLSMGKTH